MASESRYFGRRYKLHFDVNGTSLDLDSTTTYTPCDIKFDVSYAQGQTARAGTIGVLGLKEEDIEVFLRLSAMTRGEAMSEMVHCRLDAGYESAAGMVNIMDGIVWYASVTSPPQKWVNLNVCEYHQLGSKKFEIGNLKPLPLNVLCDTLCQKFSEEENIPFKCIDETEGELLSTEKARKITFAKEETVESVVKALNEQASDKVRFILCTEGDTTPRILKAVNKESDKAYDRTVYVNGNTGLLAVTGIDAINGCVTTFIDKESDQSGFCKLNLKSELNPQANGIYYIVRKQHIGHYMGQEWYTRYTCSDKKNS